MVFWLPGWEEGIEMGRNHPYLGIIYWDLARNITLENSKRVLGCSLFAFLVYAPCFSPFWALEGNWWRLPHLGSLASWLLLRIIHRSQWPEIRRWKKRKMHFVPIPSLRQHPVPGNNQIPLSQQETTLLQFQFSVNSGNTISSSCPFGPMGGNDFPLLLVSGCPANPCLLPLLCPHIVRTPINKNNSIL